MIKRYNVANNLLGWLVFAISATVYILTLEPTASFWDCGEFISSAYKLEVGHPPGNPIFMLTARFFANFASDSSHVAYMVNLMSGLLSAGAILFLFWTITHLARKLVVKDDAEMTPFQAVAALGSGLVGSLLYAFSDTFWFSAVEGEVYGYSSFCTAAVFWLILKWEQADGKPHAERYIILIAYLIGVSIGVHLLNLLCIPAIVLVWYYKRYPDANLKGSLLALLVSFGLIVALLYGLIPGFVKVAGWMELLCVNKLGMPFNSGTLLYFLLVIASIAWGLHESYRGASERRIKISFLVCISLMGVPFIGNSLWLAPLLIGGLAAWLFLRKETAVRTLNTILLCLMVIFVGYSSYAVILIRSNANPPMDQNAPDDIFTLGRYLNREQYGDRPLLYGYTFVSDVQRDLEGRPVSRSQATAMGRINNAIWTETIKSSPDEKDRYVISGYKEDYVYNPDLDMLFPRMYSRDPGHVQAYKVWSDFKGTPVRTTVNGESKTIYKPTFAENLRFFFDYQLNFMYWRYFMWNFSGRQNDEQGSGEVQNGNWITGFNFIDKHLAGDQSNLPPDMVSNKGRNVYYLMPLLLGLLGLFYQAYAGKRGIQQFWIVFFLFFMTGIAIVVYLNQTPYQPRERDYAYAGSFYAFSIWIGLGVLALASGLKRFLPPLPAAAAASVLALFVPFQMLGQNWNDHDRSGRTIARDFGMNYLSCVDENGIIFTNGDNDTFPLWYAQETEGYRTDVRVCNLSYLQTDWYIDQMKRPAYASTPLPISMSRADYSQGKRDYAYLVSQIKNPIPLSSAMDFLLSEDKRTKNFQGLNERIDYLPAKEFTLPIDKEAVLKNGVVPESQSDRIASEMLLSYKDKNGFFKNEIAILDMLNTNNKEGWKRPVFFATSVSPALFMNLTDYFSLVGLAYQVTPVKNGGPVGGINTEKSYEAITQRFKWGGADDPNVYLDPTCRQMCRSLRTILIRVAGALAQEGQKEKAIEILNLCQEKLPASAIPMTDLFGTEMGRLYLQLGEKEQGQAVLNGIAENAAANARWFLGLTDNQLLSSGDRFSENLDILHQVIALYVQQGDTESATAAAVEYDALEKAVKLRFGMNDETPGEFGGTADSLDF